MITDEVITIDWTCQTCKFDNYEEFESLPETVICGRCGNEFEYDDAADKPSGVDTQILTYQCNDAGFRL